MCLSFYPARIERIEARPINSTIAYTFPLKLSLASGAITHYRGWRWADDFPEKIGVGFVTHNPVTRHFTATSVNIMRVTLRA
jgi:hypothetical protein